LNRSVGFSILLTVLLLLPSLALSSNQVFGGLVDNGSIMIDSNWLKKLPDKGIEKLAKFDGDVVRIKHGFKIVGDRGSIDLKRYLVIADNDVATARYIVHNVFKLLYRLPLSPNKSIYIVLADHGDAEALAKYPHVYGLSYDIPFYRSIKNRNIDFEKIASFHTTGGVESYSLNNGGEYLHALEIIGVPNVWDEYGLHGENITIGVVDTGVDFSNPELGLDAVARDEDGYPLIINIDNGLAIFNGLASAHNGVLNTSGLMLLAFDPINGSLVVLQLGFNITVGNITSASGFYRVGLAPLIYYDYHIDAWILMYVVGVMVDSREPGVYDRVYFDLSTAFYILSMTIREIELEKYNTTYWREPDPSWLDYSIIDEQWHGPGDEIIARDFDGDGVYDFSLGTIAGYYIDSMGYVNASLNIVDDNIVIKLGNPGYYRGWDYSGRFLSIINDYDGHGTSVSTLIAGRGKLDYQLYGEHGTKLRGVAPSSKLAACEPWWDGDTLISEAWMAGFEPYITIVDNASFIDLDPYGPRRADIISNSWGYIYVNFMLQNFPGTDLLSAYMDNLLVTRNYLVGKPVIMVFAAGNEGPGYSTLSSPGAGLFTITVGASTSYRFLTAYGFPEGYYDEVIPFSSRGPNALGYPKPDVVNIGAWEYAGTRTIDGYGYGAGVELFGGTSEATPLTSGVLALVSQAFYNMTGHKLDPVSAKVVLKSSADDLGYSAYIQGSGRVNAYKAVKSVFTGKWFALIGDGFREAFLENYLNLYGEIAYNITRILYDTSYYGVVPQGLSKNITLITIGNGEAHLSSRELVFYKEYDAYSGVYDFKTILPIHIPKLAYMYSDYIDVIVLLKNLTYPKGLFMRTPIDNDHMITAALIDWRDVDGDGVMTRDEMYFISDDYRVGVETILSISEPCRKIGGDPYLLLYSPIDMGVENIAPVEVEVVVRAYRYVEPDIIYYPKTINVNGIGLFNITINVPFNAKPGLREIQLVIDTADERIVLPLSILIPLKLDDVSITFVGASRSIYRYDNYVLYGTYDLLGVWETLDWRMLPIIITDPEISGVLFIARWGSGYATDLSFLVTPPGGLFNELGEPNYFASYKLAYDLGYVYNPNIRDQLQGKLRMYLPVKWGLPVREHTLDILYLGEWPPYPMLYMVGYSVKPSTAYGLYRLFYGFASYSGRSIDDIVSFRIITVKTSIYYHESVREGDVSIGVISYEFKAGLYAPFIYSSIYMVTNSSTTYPSNAVSSIVPVSILINGTATQITSYWLINIYGGYYLGTTMYGKTVKGTVSVTINTTDNPEINIILVMSSYPWHAEGLYIYDQYTGETLMVSYMYLGIVSSILI